MMIAADTEGVMVTLVLILAIIALVLYIAGRVHR